MYYYSILQRLVYPTIASNKKTIKRWYINVLSFFICIYVQNKNVAFLRILETKKSKNDFICDKNVTKKQSICIKM